MKKPVCFEAFKDNGMKITCISDLHGYYPKLGGGDLLIVAGDLTARDAPQEHLKFVEWLRKQSYTMKIFIAGNHDNALQKCAIHGTSGDSCFYLCDSGTEFEGLRIWGSPWTLTFERMNSRCKAFTVDLEEELDIKFSLIPDDVDILITHSPAYGILDKTPNGCVGSLSLRKHLMRVKAALHVFGHIHECGGTCVHLNDCICVNASYVDENYKPVNKPIDFGIMRQIT
jgi:Icc-related predicted phosphoesterase